MKRRGRIGRRIAADAGDAFQFGPAAGIGLSRRKFEGVVRIALGIADRAFASEDHGFVEMDFPDVLRDAGRTGREASAMTPPNPLDSRMMS